jgi:predicted small metal-binding protein
LEELFYWLVILAFYLFSAYRSRKKKAIPRPLEKEVKDVIPAVPPQTKSVLDFLNDAFEKMEAEVEIPKPPRSVKKPIKPIDIVPPKVGLQIQDQSTHHIEPIFEEHFNATHNISKIQDTRRLSVLQSTIKRTRHTDTRTQDSVFHAKSRIKTLQKKYSSNPFKLGIIMQTIFDQPKAMQS